MLAAGALVASLFAVGASPAAGAAIDAKSEPSAPADFSACVGDAVQDQGFADLGSLAAAVPHINCLDYYGITLGRTADTFDPDSNVTRREMALFLYRAAGLMGVDLMGGDSDMMADYGDVAELGEDRQNAIRALARNGILMGRSDMAFEPFADITRAEMAVALVAMLDHTPGVALKKETMGANAGLYVLGAAPGALPNDRFDDAYAQTPAQVNNAISAAYELGITSGVGGGMFDPHGSIPRRDMATFIVNALAHSNARPAGVTVQVDNTSIVVSLRDGDFAPVVNATVDAFKTSTATAGRAFKDDGTCSSRVGTFDAAGTECEIDYGDDVTQTDGNLTLTLDGDVGEGQTAWVWTGDIGDKVSADTDLVKVAIAKGAADPVDPARVTMSTDLPKQPHLVAPTDVTRAHFGSTVTVTIQLQGADPDNADEFVNTVPGAGEELKYAVTVERFPGEDATGTPVHSRIPPQEVTIGSDGTVTFTITGVDTDANARGQMQYVQYTVAPVPGNTVTVAGSPAGVVFSDEAPAVTYVTVENSGPKVAPGANGRAGNRVTVTVQDQFGGPVDGAPVFLHSSNPTGDGDPVGSAIRAVALNTRTNGMVTFSYNYSGGASQETLKAAWDGYKPDPDEGGPQTADGTPGVVSATTDCEDGASTGEEEDKCGITTVDWVEPTESETQTAVSIISIDADNDQVIVDLQTNSKVTPTSINYDSTDFFTLVNEANAAPGKPLTIGEFEEAVAADLKAAEASDADDDAPTLAWASYIHDEPSDIATFTVTAGGSR